MTRPAEPAFFLHAQMIATRMHKPMITPITMPAMAPEDRGVLQNEQPSILYTYVCITALFKPIRRTDWYENTSQIIY